MTLPSIPQDKANHAVIGAVLACAGALLVGPVTGAALCLLFAIGKEIADWLSGKGTPELLDAIYTAAGGALVLLPLVVQGGA